METFTLDSPQEIVDELTYICYADNRATNPEVEPSRWRLVFGIATDRLEQRYQMDRSARLAYVHQHGGNLAVQS
jgi:hypothetical protein